MNVRSSHSAKGHQNAKGKVISQGNYTSQFSSSSFRLRWQSMIKDHLQRMEHALAEEKSRRFRASYSGYEEMAYDLHRGRMESFYQSFEHYTANSFSSLTTCFSCLMEVPQHPLQCGYTLCTACIRAYGRQNDRNSVLVDYCPLHVNSTRNMCSWTVQFKPDYAGVRVLTLDGYVNWLSRDMYTHKSIVAVSEASLHLRFSELLSRHWEANYLYKHSSIL